MSLTSVVILFVLVMTPLNAVATEAWALINGYAVNMVIRRVDRRILEEFEERVQLVDCDNSRTRTEEKYFVIGG